MSTETQRLDELAARLRETPLSADDQAEMDALLLRCPEARRRFVDHMLLQNDLNEDAAALLSGPVTVSVRPRSASWLSWRPHTAAAAGIVFGMFCTSVLFAYAAPSLGKVLTLFQDSFESGPAPEVTGLPREIGKWSGDFTEIVGEQRGVKPTSGKKMLHFLRADYEGKPKPEGSYVCDVYRLVDMRTYREHFADGGAVVQFSAEFYAPTVSVDGSSGADLLQVCACDEKAAQVLLRDGSVFDKKTAIAMAINGRRLSGSPGGVWQRISVEMRVPPKTEFLFLHIAAAGASAPHVQTSFEGRYVDDVRLSLGRRAPIP